MQNRQRPLSTIGVALALLVLIVVPVGAVHDPPSGSSTVTSPGDGTPILPGFLDDVEGQFAALSLRPDGLAFDIGDSPDPRLCKHYQGMARVNGPDGTPYMLVSRSGNQPGGFGSVACPFSDHDPGNLLVVRMGSRDTNGERLRSNRFERGWPINGVVDRRTDPPTQIRPPTPPDPRDGVVTTISFDGGAWDNYGHPGGMQVIGDVLVLAMETPYDDDLPDARFLFIDVSDPVNPSLLSHWDPPDLGDEFSTGVLGITAIRTASGDCCRYVMVAAGASNKDVRFFRSLPTATDGSTDLRSESLAWEETARFSSGQIRGCLNIDNPSDDIEDQITWPNGSGPAHQSLNLVRQGSLDGPLYMIGARNSTRFPFGDDRMDLYRIRLDSAGVPLDCFIERLDSRHFHSDPYMGGGDSANFAAASGLYLSPSGELIVYAAEYENDGPVGVSGRQTVRFGEYRHRDMARQGSPLTRPSLDVARTWEVDEGSTVTLTATGHQAVTKAWIQTFEDDGAGSSVPGTFDSDEWLAVDYVDRNADDFDDFGALRQGGVLDENAGSWRWFAPVGCTIRANDGPVAGGEDPGEDTQVLAGTGGLVIETDLDDIDFDDDMGSVTFMPNCIDYYAATIGVSWDLDDEAGFEVDGTSAEFDAGLLDGPTTRPVSARAQHPTDPTFRGRSRPTPITIQVNNVAPIIESFEVNDSTGTSLNTDIPVTLPGLPLTVAMDFTDPGVDDTQTATVDWGDGTVDTSFDAFTDASGGATGMLTHDHAFDEPGTYDVAVTLVDDDGGTTTETTTIHVVTAEEAIEVAARLLADERDAAADPDVADLLQEAIDELLGNLGGLATNGAVDALEAEDPESAITHLSLAIGFVEEAEAAGGPELSPIRNLLGLAGEFLAVDLLEDATAAVAPPSRGQARQLEQIQSLIDDGHQILRSGSYAPACRNFAQAVVKALDLIG